MVPLQADLGWPCGGCKARECHRAFFLGAGKGNPLAKEFGTWADGLPAVNFHASIADVSMSSGPQLVIICGRTGDNPRFFKEAVSKGFSHIYLEKPGAESVVELEAMEALAKEKGVSVFMGFNRNFSKYVRLAHEFMDKKDASLTLLRNDCFNSEDSLDECFERNAEGMMKNMMCHELMVLITYYALKVDSIQRVVPDKSYTVKQTRKGHQDFSRVGFTLVLKSGQEFKLVGDRQGGEHAETTVSLSGQKFTAVRPDPEILATSKRLEEECPGCMPYFYLQDGEYIALKQQVVSHIVSRSSGMPEGVASISHAIECLKVCDFVTEALNA